MSAIHNIPVPAKDTAIEAKKPFPGGRGRTMTNASEKYRPYGVVDLPDRTWPSKEITQPPIWCSVDLRDGNQALPNPLDPEQKLEYFRLISIFGLYDLGLLSHLSRKRLRDQCAF